MIHGVAEAAIHELNSFFDSQFSQLLNAAIKRKQIKLENVVLLEEAELRAIALNAAASAINSLSEKLGAIH